MCNNNDTNHNTDISTLQFIHKSRNFMHVISMLSTIRFRFRPDTLANIRQIRFRLDFKNLNAVHPKILLTYNL